MLVTAVATYHGGPWDFHGNVLPNTGGNLRWFVYTYTFEIDESQYISVNDINTHNIVAVYNNAVVNEDGDVESEDIQEAVVYFASESDIPAEGTNLSSWGLWTYNGGMISQDASFLNRVKVNDNGRYVDVVGMDPVGDGTQPWMKKYTNLRIYLKNGSSLGENEVRIVDFSLFPNPTNSIFSITTNMANITKIEVCNAKGQLIMQQYTNNQNTIHINLSHFQNGIYFVKVIDNKNNTSNFKLIKK